MFKKLEFNNLVITNKKQIQQARAQTISKLVNKLRKLKEALKKQPENGKFQERIRKTVECMSELKSLKCFDIMRSLLLHDGNNHNAVLTNGRATPDEIAIAMLGLNKVMQTLVAVFKQTLDLANVDNADWRTAILETSKRRLKIERTEEKRRKRRELKEQKLQARNRIEWLEQNQPEIDNFEGNERNLIDTAAGKCLVESSTSKESHEKPKLKTKNNSKQVTKVQAKSKQRKVEQIDVKPKKSMAEVAVTEVEENPMRMDTAVQPKHKEINGTESNAAFNDKRSRVKKTEKERPTHVVDPFFITDSGQPYLSTAVVLSGDSNNESDEDEPQNNVEQRKQKPLARKQDYNNARFNERHPAWVAKEQQRPIVSNFRGKKTKFSEDGDITESTVAPLVVAAPTPNPANAEGMHPSWVAKQKLKPKIAVFSGKKIKFDD